MSRIFHTKCGGFQEENQEVGGRGWGMSVLEVIIK
jgi:hypothetical protein